MILGLEGVASQPPGTDRKQTTALTGEGFSALRWAQSTLAA